MANKMGNVTSLEEIERQSRKNARKRLVIVLVVLVLVLILFAVIGYLVSIRTYENYRVLTNVEWTHTATSRVLPYGNNFISYSADGIRCTNAKGVDVWSHAYVMQEPMVSIDGEYVAVADYNGNELFIFDSSGLINTIATGMPITKIEVSASGSVLTILDSGNLTPIHLYYKDGRDLVSFRVTMSQGGYPVAVDISDNSRLAAVSHLYMNGSNVVSKLVFYNFGEVGKNESDNIVSAYDYQGAVAPIVRFFDDSHAFVMTDERVAFFQGDQRPSSVADCLIQEKVRSVYNNEDYLGLVFPDLTGNNNYRLDIYTDMGVLKNSIYFDMEYDEIIFSGNLVLIYNSGGCMIYSVDGRLRFLGDFEEPVLLMIPTSVDTRYTLVLDHAIQTIQLQ